jgi:uncharacterized repeat protein (TIGR02543 family)
MMYLRTGGRVLVGIVLFLATITQGRGQYSLLHGFTGAPGDGANPRYGSLATDGTLLYGLTFNGGVSNKGTVFSISLDGTSYRVLHSFVGLSFPEILLNGVSTASGGANPYGTPLLIGSTLYGMTVRGGTNGTGSIFKLGTDGNGFQLLHSFGGGFGPWDGFISSGSLITDGTNLYGMTSTSLAGMGSIFVLNTNGTGYRTLHTFAADPSDGANARGSLVLSGGILYGMTLGGGTNGLGTIFQIGIDGSGFQILHHFGGGANDGASPYWSLVLANSMLYGTTSAGGSGNVGTVFRIQTNGSGFEVLHSFSMANAWQPMDNLTLSNSTLYGMTTGTNSLGLGSVFQVNTDGSGFQIVHTFSYGAGNLTEGSMPYGTLLLVGSRLYGTTMAGGSSQNAGALFLLGTTLTAGGSISVTLLPAGAVSAGAEWAVDGGIFLKSGAVATNFSAGPHIISFKPISGWLTPANQTITVVAGAESSASATYVSNDASKPTVKVLTPTAGSRESNYVFTASGVASDIAGIAQVNYQLNNGPWAAAATANGWTNWVVTNLNPTPGTNVIKLYAVDTVGNVSTTNTVPFTFVLTAPLSVTTNGAGSFKPDLNGAALEIGKTFTMTAKPVKGYTFVNWTGSVNTNSAKLTFVMASNLAFTANFKDVARPVNVILSPTRNQTVSNSAPMASGKAKDNTGVTAVWYRVDGGSWLSANLLGGTNWSTASLTPGLLSGPNSIAAFALDAAGNASLSNSIAFKYQIEPGADWAPDSLNGLLALVAPASGSTEEVGFDVATFAQTGGTNSANAQDYGAGGYTYLKIDTNHAQLSLTFTTPPAGSNTVGPVDLVFTNHYAGYFSNEAEGDVGNLALSIATNFIPAKVVGKTITTVSSSGRIAHFKLASAVGFTETPANNSVTGTSSGTYTFKRFSPVCGVFALAYTDAIAAGQSAYLQITFATRTTGSYFVVGFDSSGVLQDVDNGRFTMK